MESAKKLRQESPVYEDSNLNFNPSPVKSTSPNMKNETSLTQQTKASDQRNVSDLMTAS